MPDNQNDTAIEHEEQRKANEQRQQQEARPMHPEEQEHTDDFDDDTEELSADDADGGRADQSAGEQGIDDVDERRVAPDDADIESGKRLDRDEGNRRDIEREAREGRDAQEDEENG